MVENLEIVEEGKGVTEPACKKSRDRQAEEGSDEDSEPQQPIFAFVSIFIVLFRYASQQPRWAVQVPRWCEY